MGNCQSCGQGLGGFNQPCSNNQCRYGVVQEGMGQSHPVATAAVMGHFHQSGEHAGHFHASEDSTGEVLDGSVVRGQFFTSGPNAGRFQADDGRLLQATQFRDAINGNNYALDGHSAKWYKLKAKQQKLACKMAKADAKRCRC